MTYPDAFTDLTDSGIDFSQFAEGKTAYSVVDGKNYGVPFDNGAVVACYRTDVLEEAGLTVDDFTDITWDQYLENGKKVLEKTGKPLLSMQAGECDLIMMMLQSAGSSLFNEDGSANIVNNAALKKVMETYKSLKDAGVLVEVNSWAVTSNCKNTELAVDFLAKTFAGSTELYDNILSCGAIATWAPAGDSDAYAELQTAEDTVNFNMGQ